MAKPKQPSKGLRDIDNLPDIPEMYEDGVTERLNILDHDAPPGRYQVDTVILEMHQRRCIDQSTTAEDLIANARATADVAGWMALREAKNELSEGRRRIEANGLFDHLEQISRAARALKRMVPEELAPFIAREDDVDYPEDEVKRAKRSVQFAEATIEELLAKIAKVNMQVEAFQRRYSVAKGNGTSAEPLTKWFIFGCATSWRGLTGAWPRKADHADFRRFLVAGWTDLAFPAPVDRHGEPKPIEDHFKDRLAKSDVFDHFTETAP